MFDCTGQVCLDGWDPGTELLHNLEVQKRNHPLTHKMLPEDGAFAGQA